jgi:hypothetical protein
LGVGINILGRKVSMVKGRREGSAMYLDQFAFFGQFLEVSSDGIIRYIDVLAKVSRQHFIVQIYLVKNVGLSFSFKHSH